MRIHITVLLCMLLLAGLRQAAFSAPPACQAQPGASLVLQAVIDGGVKCPVGPQPAKATLDDDAVVHGKAHTGLKLTRSEVVWQLGTQLPAAQGAVSFWVKIAPDNTQPCIIETSATGGGSWRLALEETKYDASASAPAPEEAGADAGPAAGETPDATLKCEISGSLFAEAQVPFSARMTVPCAVKGDWHHVLWSWRSIWHFVYIDGKPAGSAAAASRMAPVTNPAATLTWKRSGGMLADFRLYNRALEPEEAALLATAPPDAYLPAPPSSRLWVDWTRTTGRSVVYAEAPPATAKRGSPAATPVTIPCCARRRCHTSPPGWRRRCCPATSRFPPEAIAMMGSPTTLPVR